MIWEGDSESSFTYLLRLRFILCRIELLGLLCVVWYRALALAELLRLVLHLSGVLFRRHGSCVVKGFG